MGGRWAQASGWLCRGLLSRVNKALPQTVTAHFFWGPFTHTRVAVGTIFGRPVDRTAIVTTTQRYMHSLPTPSDCLANRMGGPRPIIQSSAFSVCFYRTSTPYILANTVAVVSPLPARQLQPIRTLATHSQSPDSRSRFRGVYWEHNVSKWISRVYAIMFHVGCFDRQVSAARHTDTAIRYLVQCKVLDEKYLARTNVSLGLLEQFEPTAEETETVVKRWEKRLRRENTSVFRGVSRHREGRPAGSGTIWQANTSVEPGTQRHIGCFSTEFEAACAVDVAVRASKWPKPEKIKRINFYWESDYLTEGQVRRGRCIGVSRRGKRISKRWAVCGPYIKFTSVAEKPISSSAATCLMKYPYLGVYATKLEAVEVYDRFVLDRWAQQGEPWGPLPPTNFSPTRFGFNFTCPPNKYSHTN